MLTNLKSMIRDEAGASMVEYGLLIAFIAIVAMVGVKAVGTNLNIALRRTSATSL